MSTALILLSDFQKTEIELWRPVAQAPNYDVSTLGRVRSWVQQVRGLGHRGGFTTTRRKTPRVLKINTCRLYSTICLQSNVGEKTFLVHRLVAQAFLLQPTDCDEVNHKSAVKADCRMDNLEWSNHQRNHEHATVNRLRPSGEKHHWSVLTEAKVREMRALRVAGMGNKEIAARFNMSYYTAWEVTTYQTWKYVE